MARPAISDLQGKLIYAQTTPSPLPKSSTPVAPPPSAARKTDQEIFEDLRVWIEKEKPTRDQIRKRVEELRSLQTPIKK